MLALLSLLLACHADSDASGRPPNILVVLTDDQRADMLDPLPEVQARVFDQGLVFDDAIVNTPLCCPMRASFLSGGFLAHQTGVLANEGEQGGVDAFDDRGAIGRSFQAAGYRTALIGKYLNLYEGDERYIPPGWDRFTVPLPVDDWTHYALVSGSSGADAAEGVNADSRQYVTDLLHVEAARFLLEPDDRPFFLVLAETAAHDFAQPAAQDDDTYAGAAWRGGAYDEADVSDKPGFIQGLPNIDDDTRAEQDALYQDALESLLAVDRGVAGVLDVLDAQGRLDDTVIVFTSDNGHLFGEHRLWSKGVPYEESLRVPLAIRLPGGVAGQHEARQVSVTTDLPATLFSLAGIDAPTAGTSLAPLLQGDHVELPDARLIEGYATGWSPDYAGLRTAEWKYVEYATGETELYELSADPFEELNLAGDADLADLQAQLAASLDEQRGLVLLPAMLQLDLGVDADVQLEHWGGEGALRFATSDPLPAGLALTEDGRLTGAPEEAGTFVFAVTVSDSSASPYHGGSQRFTRSIWLSVGDSGFPHLVAPPVVQRNGDRATVTLSLSHDVPLSAWVGGDPLLDLNPRPVPVDEGRVVIDGLDDHPAWLRVDGLPRPVRIRLPPR